MRKVKAILSEAFSYTTDGMAAPTLERLCLWGTWKAEAPGRFAFHPIRDLPKFNDEGVEVVEASVYCPALDMEHPTYPGRDSGSLVGDIDSPGRGTWWTIYNVPYPPEGGQTASDAERA